MSIHVSVQKHVTGCLSHTQLKGCNFISVYENYTRYQPFISLYVSMREIASHTLYVDAMRIIARIDSVILYEFAALNFAVTFRKTARQSFQSKYIYPLSFDANTYLVQIELGMVSSCQYWKM